MLAFLKNHPFAVEAYFKRSIVLTFAVPKAQLQSLIPECLTLDTFQDKLAFLAIAMVQTRNLRPRGFWKFMGTDFFLIGYRVFVRYKSTSGKNLRGLYILKSETNKSKMTIVGNLFTHYNYTTTDIEVNEGLGGIEISSIASKFKVKIDEPTEEIDLPQYSPFAGWKEARRFAGPLPFTFTYDKPKNQVLIVEGVRENWKPTPVRISDYEFAFLTSLNLHGCCLANAFMIRDVSYYWKKGKIEQW